MNCDVSRLTNWPHDVALDLLKREHLMSADQLGTRIQNTGTAMLRYGLVAILVMIGAT
jgi:hypothetical protein